MTALAPVLASTLVSGGVSAAVCLLLALAPGAALAQPATSTPPKPAPACGIRFLPLAPGNEWTYAKEGGQDQVIVKVLDVAPGKDWQDKPVTVIKVEETYGKKVVTSELTCTAAGIVVPPDSFFFSGEPGGLSGMTRTITAQESVTLAPDGTLIPQANWVQKIKMDVTRQDTAGQGAQHAPSKVEVERYVIVQGLEPLDLADGTTTSVQKVMFELRGRAIVEDQKLEIPVRRQGHFFYQRGVGAVRIEDVFQSAWTLVSSKV